MRVDSTDAANYTAITPNRAPEQTKHVEKPVETQTQTQPVQDEFSSSITSKPMSQITQTEKSELKISEKTLIDAIEKANKAALGRNTSCKFTVHEATKRISIKIFDSDTNEVIREIPPEKVLDMVAKLWEMAGIFVDKKG